MSKGITNTPMRKRMEIEDKILTIYAKERSSGNSQLKHSRISPRRQGKLQALRWVIGQIKELKI